MGASVLGKRSRNQDSDSQEQLPIKHTRRYTRSFREGNDENQDPTTTATVNSGDESQDEEVTVFSPAVTRTPSARRTKKLSDVEPLDYPIKAPITPSTPRHRDVFARVPVTPRHRVMSVGKLSRRMTPKTPLTPAASQTIYHQARQLFSRSADPGQLIGREEERSTLRNFLGRRDTPQPHGCIYVSGPPGTGKSAMVNEITDEVVAGTPSAKKAYINCMSIKSSKDLYMTLLDLLCHETDMEEDDATVMLQKTFVPKRKSQDVYVVVLDEIDHILSLDLESLYKVFEWSMQKSSRLLLVGIANALDLTDRFLPRLKSRNLKPELLPFLPYTAPQVKMIITKRLKSLLPKDAQSDFTPFFHPAAIELCSRKVSSQTGDLRKAFEICRRALDLVENETRMNLENDAKEQTLQMTPSRKVLGEMKNETSPGSKAEGRSLISILSASLHALTVETAPRVSISHLNKVTSAAFSNGTNQRLKTLNLQQKAALCALHALERRNREAIRNSTPTTPSRLFASTPTSKSNAVAAPTVKTLFDTYALLCKRSDAVALHPLSSSEFREVVGSLETLSLVAAVDGKNGSFVAGSQPGTPTGRKGRKPAFVGGSVDDKRVASCVGDREIEQAAEGPGADILRSILSGEALD